MKSLHVADWFSEEVAEKHINMAHQFDMLEKRL